MFIERSETTRAIQALAASACTELMQAYGVQLNPTRGWADSDPVRLPGLMDCVGDGVAGTCPLARATRTTGGRAPTGGARAAVGGWGSGRLPWQRVDSTREKSMGRPNQQADLRSISSHHGQRASVIEEG